MDLAGRHAVVTGGSSGIGLAVAGELVRAGCHVHLVARDEARLAVAAAALRGGQEGARVTARPCDVTDAPGVDALFEVLRHEGVDVSILVNSAGQTRPGYFEELDAEVFERLMRVNFFGTLSTTRAAVPLMVERGEGYIVNVSSVAGLMGVFGYTAYSASKFAVTGFTEALRAELEPKGICVCLVCPGDVDTPMLENEQALMPAETRALNASAGVITADVVARAIVAGMSRRQAVVVPGRDARFATTAHRLLPGLVQRVVQRTIRKARRR